MIGTNGRFPRPDAPPRAGSLNGEIPSAGRNKRADTRCSRMAAGIHYPASAGPARERSATGGYRLHWEIACSEQGRIIPHCTHPAQGVVLASFEKANDKRRQCKHPMNAKPSSHEGQYAVQDPPLAKKVGWQIGSAGGFNGSVTLKAPSCSGFIGLSLSGSIHDYLLKPHSTLGSRTQSIRNNGCFPQRYFHVPIISQTIMKTSALIPLLLALAGFVGIVPSTHSQVILKSQHHQRHGPLQQCQSGHSQPARIRRATKAWTRSMWSPTANRRRRPSTPPDDVPTTSRTSTTFEVVVDSSEAGHCLLGGAAHHHGQRAGAVLFDARMSEPVFAGGPPVTVDFAECVGVLTVHFVDASGDPVAVDGGLIHNDSYTYRP